MTTQVRDQAATPCIGICSTGIGDTVCRGCKRFAHEVIDWNTYSEEQRALVNRRLGEFLSRCVSSKLTVTDAELLSRELASRATRYNAAGDEYGLAYLLLCAGAELVRNPATCGFVVHAPYNALPTGALRDMIDQEFYQLTEAHYERYIAPFARLPR